MPEYQDRAIVCSDCQQEFVFTSKEQSFYAAQKDAKTGLPYSAPKRCRPCRDIRKQDRAKQDQQRG